MNNNKMMIQLSLEDIINSKVEVCLNSEYRDYCEGDITSYTEMMVDIKTMTMKEFSEKFLKRLEFFDEQNSLIEAPCDGKVIPQKKVLMLMGHIHAIGDILGLVTPSCQYRFRERTVTKPLVSSKKMMEITVKDIINYHLEFYSNNDDFFRDDEEIENDIRDMARGYVFGYNQMISDVEIMPIGEFYKKYSKIQDDIGEKLHQDDSHLKFHEIEILSGHNNAIGDILDLINHN